MPGMIVAGPLFVPPGSIFVVGEQRYVLLSGQRIAWFDFEVGKQRYGLLNGQRMI
jgi:hypothetical protein